MARSDVSHTCFLKTACFPGNVCQSHHNAGGAGRVGVRAGLLRMLPHNPAVVSLATELLGTAPRLPRRVRGLYTVWPT